MFIQLSTQIKRQEGKQTIFYKEQNISLCNDLREHSPRSYHTDAKATGKNLPRCLYTCSETANFSSHYTAPAALLYIKLKEKGWSSTPSLSLKLVAELKMRSSVEYFLADMCNSACASNVSCGMHWSWCRNGAVDFREAFQMACIQAMSIFTIFSAFHVSVLIDAVRKISLYVIFMQFSHCLVRNIQDYLNSYNIGDITVFR